ncbi:MBOAT family protein [Chryseobacterium sp. SNU WT5]|uniref:MBOAT family O-acyltransferase n=1 Tax=Chryseobacterium sp. SNU WT5 TaxID=2594269 RepID=UPI00117C9F49|nr:MBOAT family O-acyltransferase [Chryseobacterium sp. SNU WT5]QDP85535.1 MBOAT family protein [Chryseobacterium sp. SNU WT5]
MLFNSLDFAIFLPIVFGLYWFVTNKNLKFQNVLIVVASYYFYGLWDWRFLGLILFSTVLDYSLGVALGKYEKPNHRKILLWISIITNLGFLGIFKYYNFFLDNFIEVFSVFGYRFSAGSLSIILPVGISFYTFQTLSYTIDVYKNKLEPTKDFVAFAAFVSFFPQLVAGPIERATHLLPQFYKKRHFNYQLASDGIRQILWGLFKKMVVADNCSPIVNEIFANYQNESGSTLVLGAVLFAFQIYGDFSGYSDIAIGTSRLFGFDLMKNFNYPYFSRDIAEFWRRWHISLSTWFRDYLYIPLGGSKGGLWMKIRNTFIIFIVSGFWHGANWTFIFWGTLNALFFLPLLLRETNRSNLDAVALGKLIPNFREFFSILLTFGLVCFAWIFFRAENLSQAFSYIESIFTWNLLSIPPKFPTKEIGFIGILLLFEWMNRTQEHGLEIERFNVWIRRSLYLCVMFLILRYANFGNNEFIYFQF